MKDRINFSSFLHQAALLSYEDLNKLFDEMGSFSFFNVSSLQKDPIDSISKQSFLSFYKQYLEDLFSSKQLDVALISKMFSQAMARDPECFSKMELSEGRFLIKAARSVIQMQPLALFASSIDKQIHVKSFAKEAQSFGIKFSFPTIYEIASSHKIVELDPKDVEYALFNVIRRFLRHHTRPLAVVGPEGKNVYSFRYSNSLQNEVEAMPFFGEQGLKVVL
jgi:hypothetical protein